MNTELSGEEIVTVPCFFCRNNIGFDATRLPQPRLADEPFRVLFKQPTASVLAWECPHCGKTTYLYHPRSDKGLQEARRRYNANPQSTFLCPCCKRELSLSAKCCPQCGWRSSSIVPEIIGLILIVLIILALIGSCASGLFR